MLPNLRSNMAYPRQSGDRLVTVVMKDRVAPAASMWVVVPANRIIATGKDAVTACVMPPVLHLALVGWWRLS